MSNLKPKTEVKAAFIALVVEYLKDVCGMSGEHIAEASARYIGGQWHYVEAVYDAGCITGLNSSASDLTCDFCCRLLANRV